MERDIRRQLFKGGFIYAIIFASLFVLHIIFAAKNFKTWFKIVAATITALTFFVGITIIYFGKIKTQRVKINRIGGIISIFLACGLGWAYAGMMMHWSIVLWPFSTVFCHLIVERLLLVEHHDLK